MESVCNYDFSLLPPHVIAQVFTNLKLRECLRAAQTCKSWYFASCDPIISRNICVRIAGHKRLSRLDNLIRPFGKVSLTIDFDKFQYRDFFEKFAQQLRCIVFTWCELSVEQLIDCLSYSTNLTRLEFTGQKYSYATPSPNEPNINETTMELVTRNLQSVKSLHIETDSILSSGIRLIMFRMINLETIEYIASFSSSFEPLIEYIKKFDDLKLRHLVIGYVVRADFFHSFAKIKTKLNLHSLNIQSIHDNFYDSDFTVFCKKLSNFKVLSTTVTENHLIDVCRYMRNLVELKLLISNTQKLHYVRTLQSLEKLVITTNFYHHEDNEEELIELLSVPLVNLQHLHIEYRMSLTVLEELCKNYKHLKALKLSGLNTFNIEAIYKNLVNLKSLELHFYVDHIQTKVDMDFDITNLKLLEELDISSSVPGATWDVIKQLPNLKPATKKALELKLNCGYVDPLDEATFNLVQNLYD